MIMIETIRDDSLPPLPRAFTIDTQDGSTDTVDVQLLIEICRIYPEPGHLTRALFKQMHSEVLSQSKDTFQVLAEHLPYQSFRYEWYCLTDRPTKKKLLPPLFLLIDTFISGKTEKRLGFESVPLKPFFEKRKGKTFPRLDQIATLCDQLDVVSAENPRWAALFAWSLVERTQWHYLKTIKDDSLRDFQKSLLAELRRREKRDLLGLLEPADWPEIEHSDPFPSRTADTPILEAVHHTPAPISKPTDTEEKESKSEHDSAIKAIEASITSLTADISQQGTILSQASSADEPSSALRQVSKATGELAKQTESLVDKSKTLLDSIFGQARIHLEQFGITLPEFDHPALNLARPDGWLAYAGSQAHLAEQIAHKCVALSSEALHQLQIQDSSERSAATSLQNSLDLLASKERKTRILRDGMNARQRITETMQRFSTDFSWNPLTSTEIAKEDWIALARSMIQKGEWTPVLGVLLRTSFDLLSDDIHALQDAIRSDDGSNFRGFFEILSLLTLDQLEALDDDHQVARTTFGLAELQAFLVALETSNSLSDCFGYWSAKPLAELSQFESETYLPFFKATFEFFRDEDDTSSHKLSSFREAIQRRKHLTVSAHGTIAVHRLEQRLREILTFHPGGGQNYSAMWQQAYKILCAPILARLESEGLNAAITLCRTVIAEFRIEDHLHKWKQGLNADLRKNSQYDKKIRLSVNSKISELGGFLALLDSENTKSTPLKPTTTDKLVDGIHSALLATDIPSNLVRKWMGTIQDTTAARGVIHLQRTGSLAPSIDRPIMIPSSIQYPRCAVAQGPNEQAPAGVHLADTLFAHLSPISTEMLLESFLEQGLLEECRQLAAEISDNIPPDLQRRIQHDVETKEEEYGKRLGALEGSLKSSAPNELELEKSSLLDAKKLFAEQRWRTLERELIQLEELVIANKSARIEQAESERLRGELRALGASPSERASVADLTQLLERVRKEKVERDPILRHINELLRVPELDRDIRQLAESVVTTMIRSGATVGESDLPALYAEEMFGYLRQELLRSRNLKETYKAKLVKLTQSILHLMLPENGGLLEGTSSLMRFLEESGEDWKNIPIRGEDVVGTLLDRLNKLGGDAIDAPAFNPSPNTHPINAKIGAIASPDPTDAGDKHSSQREIDTLVGVLSARLRRDNPHPQGLSSPRETELDNALLKEDWLRFESLSAQGFLTAPESDLGRFHLAGWGAAKLKKSPDELSTEEFAGALALANRYPEHPAIKRISSQKGSSNILSDLARAFVSRIVRDNSQKSSSGTSREDLQELATSEQSLGKYRLAFAAVFSADAKGRGTMLRALWDSFSNEKKQHEARADLMIIMWHLSASEALAACLTYPPISLEPRMATALAEVAKQALQEGKVQLLQSFFDLKKTIEARPFALFVNALHIPGSNRSEAPAKLQLVSGLNRISGGVYQAVLAIRPRASERPERIELTLPQNAAARFKLGHPLRIELEGPFLEDEVFRSVTFQLPDEKVTRFTERVSCKAISINGETTTFQEDLDFEIASAMEFSPPTPEEINSAFANFPAEQMREDDYVEREDDERKIEKSLFAETVRSLWISSPRRSGKTTMLYRILDHYSHKSGRSDLVAFFTLNRSFSGTTEFNKWIWTELRTTHANDELRALFDDFKSDIGPELPFDASVATFIGELSTRLREKCRDKSVDRVIYLIDEVDRFATMYFDGGERKDAATDILWQIRELLSSSRDIGFVFAGSTAANRIFVTSSDAPFYNRNIGFELTPFSCDDPKLSHAARRIAEPSRLKGRFVMNRQTLEHLLWVCAGIPYYMKLLAGATYAVARQPNLVPSDVNRGLWALLNKETKISRLDGTSDIPGSDELRTVALAEGSEKTLLLAVVYAAAETSSPLSGRILRRAQLYAEDAILTTRFHLSKKKIQHGIELAITYGVLKASHNDFHQISFGIPFLGEAIGRNIGHFWGQIAHKLDEIAEAAES